MIMNRKFAFTLALFGCLLLPARSQAQFFKDPSASFTRTNPTFLKAFKEVVAKPSASTVRVQCDGKDTALGTIVGPDGWILTKANDLKGEIAVKLRDGKTYEARWVGVHQQNDVALLKIETSGLKPVEFSDSKNVGVGSWLACAGVNDEPVAVGVVSVATRAVPRGAMSFPAIARAKSARASFCFASALASTISTASPERGWCFKSPSVPSALTTAMTPRPSSLVPFHAPSRTDQNIMPSLPARFISEFAKQDPV